MYIFFCMYVCVQRKRKIAHFENQLKFKCQHLVIQPASPVCHQTHESYNGCSNLTPRITHSHCHSPSVHTLYSYTGCAAYGGCRHYSPLAGVTRATRLPRGHGCCACCACSNQSCSKSIAQIEWFQWMNWMAVADARQKIQMQTHTVAETHSPTHTEHSFSISRTSVYDSSQHSLYM